MFGLEKAPLAAERQSLGAHGPQQVPTVIIRPSELSELQTYFDRLEQIWQLGDDAQWEREDLETNFFGERPHLLMLVGFDEFRVFHKSDERAVELLSHYDPTPFPGGIEYESLFRERKSGAWKWFEGVAPASSARAWGGRAARSLHFKHEGTSGNALIPTSTLLRAMAQALRTPPAEAHVLVLPKLWTPGAQRLQRLQLSDSIGEILHRIHDQERSLEELTPRQLEELVAALLQAKGMQIHVTPYSRDGGRDIIARGELVPGEPCLLAVEVKKKAVVGLADVERALHANRFFSALMVATTGRFSAGVVREKRTQDNELRLILKDGVAIRQWIDLHGIAHGWRLTRHAADSARGR